MIASAGFRPDPPIVAKENAVVDSPQQAGEQGWSCSSQPAKRQITKAIILKTARLVKLNEQALCAIV
jgi:hypothetical protein